MADRRPSAPSDETGPSTSTKNTALRQPSVPSDQAGPSNPVRRRPVVKVASPVKAAPKGGARANVSGGFYIPQLLHQGKITVIIDPEGDDEITPELWKVEHVSEFLSKNGFKKYRKRFLLEGIDGHALVNVVTFTEIAELLQDDCISKITLLLKLINKLKSVSTSL